MERSARPGVVRRMVSGVWRAMDRLRQISLNLLFIAVVVFLLAGWWASRPAPLPTDAALLIAPNGNWSSSAPCARAMSVLQGGDGHSPGAAARRGGRDPCRRHRSAHQGAGDRDRRSWRAPACSKLQEIAAAIVEFRKTGKKVYAHGKNYNQVQYHLAAQADEVFVSPDGYVY
jgi:protease-4